MTKRAVAYARVSTLKQADNTSLKTQLDQIEQHCKECGYQIVERLQFAHSGASADLPGIQRLLEIGQNDEADIVVVWRVDRFLRGDDANTDPGVDAAITERQLNKAGLEVEYLDLPDRDSEAYVWMKTIKRVVASVERRDIVHRTTTGRRKKVLAGNVMVSGRPPYGYSLVKDDGTSSLVVREDEARIVELIYQWYVHGDEPGKPLAIEAIARRLTAMGVPTKADHNKLIHKERGFGKWTRSSVIHILSNETYVGRWYYGKRKWVKQNGKRRQIEKPRSEWICVSVPQLIDETTWKLAQRKREQNKRRRKQVHNYLLNGHVSCGTCGARMRGCPSHSKGHIYLYYRCPGTQGQRLEECDAPVFRADGEGAWDDIVWTWITECLQDPARAEKGLRHKQADREKANKPLRTKLAAIDDLLTENTNQLERLLDLYLSGEFDKAILAERKARLENTIANLESQRASIAEQIEAETPTDQEIETLVEYARKLAKGIEVASGDFEEKRRIVEMLDLEAKFCVEDGEQVCRVDGILGKGRLQRGCNTSKCKYCQHRDNW